MKIVLLFALIPGGWFVSGIVARFILREKLEKPFQLMREIENTFLMGIVSTPLIAGAICVVGAVLVAVSWVSSFFS